MRKIMQNFFLSGTDEDSKSETYVFQCLNDLVRCIKTENFKISKHISVNFPTNVGGTVETSVSLILRSVQNPITDYVL